LPLTDTTAVDIVVSNGNMDLKKIQAKYTSIINGCIQIRLYSVSRGKSILVSKDHIDYYAAYCPDNGLTYYIPISEFGDQRNLWLRVHECKGNGQKKHIRLADQYLNFCF
jgi:hypothetical protein